MKDEADRGIVDQSALGMRVATFSAGIWLTYVVCLTSAVYVAFTWGRPNRGLLLATFGLGMLGGLVAAQLPRERIVRGPVDSKVGDEVRSKLALLKKQGFVVVAHCITGFPIAGLRRGVLLSDKQAN